MTNKTIAKEKCEACQKPATNAVVDSEEDGKFPQGGQKLRAHSTHFFCDEHMRKPCRYKGTNT